MHLIAQPLVIGPLMSFRKVEQAKRLKEVEKEDTRGRKLVADLPRDNAILKEVCKGNF